MPTIDILTDSVIGWDRKIPCLLVYETDTLSAKIKCRGGYSSKYDKHSYSIKIKGFCPIKLGNDLILNANYVDKTFMRHKISYDLYRKMNPLKNKAPKCEYVRLCVNGEYCGLYVLMSRNNPNNLGLCKSDSLSMLFKEPNLFRKETHPTQAIDDDYYSQKYPSKAKSDKSYYIKEFELFLKESSDSVFASNLEKWIDLENVIDWHLILLLSNNSDGLLKNFYLYKIDKNTPFRVAIWDYDHSFGRDGDNELNMLKNVIDCNRSVLFWRLMDNATINYEEKLSERWRYLRQTGIISESAFSTLMKENQSIINDELFYNFQKWPLNSEYYYDDNDFEQELDIMLSYLKIRIPQLDAMFDFGQ